MSYSSLFTSGLRRTSTDREYEIERRRTSTLPRKTYSHSVSFVNDTQTNESNSVLNRSRSAAVQPTQRPSTGGSTRRSSWNTSVSKAKTTNTTGTFSSFDTKSVNQEVFPRDDNASFISVNSFKSDRVPRKVMPSINVELSNGEMNNGRISSNGKVPMSPISSHYKSTPPPTPPPHRALPPAPASTTYQSSYTSTSLKPPSTTSRKQKRTSFSFLSLSDSPLDVIPEPDLDRDSHAYSESSRSSPETIIMTSDPPPPLHPMYHAPPAPNLSYAPSISYAPHYAAEYAQRRSIDSTRPVHQNQRQSYKPPLRSSTAPLSQPNFQIPDDGPGMIKRNTSVNQRRGSGKPGFFSKLFGIGKGGKTR